MLRIISIQYSLVLLLYYITDTYRALTGTGVIKLQTSYAATGFRYNDIRLLGMDVDEAGKNWIYDMYLQFREEITTNNILRDKSLTCFKLLGGGHTMAATGTGVWKQKVCARGGLQISLVPACV